MAENASDRSLIEDALQQVLDAAPAGCQRVRVEFVSSAESPFARGWAVGGSDPVPVPVLPGAIELLTEHHLRAVAAGDGYRKLVVERDAAGTLTVTASQTGSRAAAAQDERRGAVQKFRRMWSRR